MGLSCDFSNTSVLIQVVVVAIVDGFGLLLTLVSIPFLVCINGIDYSLRQILISFQLANLVGGGVVTHDLLVTTCAGDDLELTTVSILLILGHIIMLLVAEYNITTSSSRKGFEALIFAVWFLSITIDLLCGRLPQAEHRYVAYIILTISVFAVFVSVVLVYINVIRKNHWLRNYSEMARSRQVDTKHRKHLSPKVYEELKYMPLVYASYIVFTLPWTIQRLYEGLNATKPQMYVKFASLLIFTFGFYFPAFVPLHMWMKMRSRRVGPCECEVRDTAAALYHSGVLAKRSTVRDDPNIFSYSYARK